MTGRAPLSRPAPLGVTLRDGGVEVAVHAPRASAVLFCLFDAAGTTEIARLRLKQRTGPVWHDFLPGIGAGARYGLRAEGEWNPAQGLLFNPARLLVDPFAVALDRPFALAPALFDPPDAPHPSPADSAGVLPKAIVTAPPAPLPSRPAFDWARQSLYELHVRGFTMRHPEVPEAQRGTFAALAHPAVIGHLKRLGVGAVELMPAAAWIDERHLPPLGLSNYWGYNPVALCAPDPRLAPGGWDEVRAGVAALQEAGIAVILDVVFNHSGEGDRLGPTLSLRGLDAPGYYRTAPDGTLVNDTGCGNTLAAERAPGLGLVMEALRSWAARAGVDGFRLDLALTLGRNGHGFDPEGAFFTAVAQDPLLAPLAWIAEPWDIGPGGYALGGFPAGWGEWNDRFRDAVRRFWRGDGGVIGELATRLAGSADVFAAPRPVSRSVNFITAHDGFTLADLVAYTAKRNHANGEDNRDGRDDNTSWNNGVEGPSDDPAVRAARARDQRALLATLLLSRGTPMISMGDEAGRSQGGNNNAYAQDNPAAWFDWEGSDQALAGFTARLLAARAACPALRSPAALIGKPADASGIADVSWHRADGAVLSGGEWSQDERRTLIAALYAPATDADPADRVLLALHAGTDRPVLNPPPPRPGFVWRRLLDSADPEAGEGPPPATLAPRSVLLLREAPAPRHRAPDPSSAAARLAREAGIAEGWWSLDGVWTPTPEDTRRALLRALGLPAEHAADSLARLAEEAVRPLPFSAALAAHERGGLRLGPDLVGKRVDLALTGEDGVVRAWSIGADDGVAEPLALPDGRVVASRRIALPPLAAGRYTLAAGEVLCRLTAAPPACYRPAALRAGGRAWGIAAQLYSLRRQGDAGVGDFTTLATLARSAAAHGAGTIGLNPLHALFPADRERASPYQPSDRRFLDPIHLDVAAPPLPLAAPGVQAALAEAAPTLAALARRDQVAWSEIWAAKSRVLEAAFAAFRPEARFAAFCAEGGAALENFARFQALAEVLGEPDWRRWPAPLRDPASPAVARAAPAARVRYHLYLQYLADRQFAAAAEAGRGLSVGFYRDLAVGAAPDGAEAWAAGNSLLAGVSVGAPPDPLGPEGQVWGLPPPDPRAMIRTGFADQAALLAANMRHAGALRIDHAMGLARLFLVPDGARGAEGTYLAYPFAARLAEVKLESTRAGCLVVGEDLGTVPDGFHEALSRAEILSYQVLRFTPKEGAGLRPPARWPALAAACAATHDVATLRGWWEGADLAERVRLGLAHDPAAERAARAAEREALLALLRAEGIDPTDLLLAVHTLLARTPCTLVLVQADDLAGETIGVNLPGTDRQRPNWRRRLAPPVEALIESREAMAVFAALAGKEGSSFS